MQHGEKTFNSFDGLRLFEQWWYPDRDLKAVIVIVHGYAEHGSRYAYTARYLTDNGFAVYVFDLRGHGRSEGPRVLVRSFDDYLFDLRHFLAGVKEREGRAPIFMLGHSMGGTIATLFTVTYNPPIQGLILSGALLKISDKFSPIFIFFISVLGYVCPRLPIVKKLNSRLISSDPREVEKYDKDPLICHDKLLAGEAREINRAVGRIQKRLEDITIPLLILHGGDDRLVEVEGSHQLYARSASKDKTLKLYKGFYHEILSEPDKDTVLSDIVSWLNKRV